MACQGRQELLHPLQNSFGDFFARILQNEMARADKTKVIAAYLEGCKIGDKLELALRMALQQTVDRRGRQLARSALTRVNLSSPWRRSGAVATMTPSNVRSTL